MRIFKGFLKTGACFLALTSCQDGMKGNEIYPKADNLIEIEPARLKIIETKNNDNGILVVVGESPNRRCDIRVADARLGQSFAANSIQGNRIKAECLWDGEKYILTRTPFTVVTVNTSERTVIDLQLYSPAVKKYLALTALTHSLTK